MTSQQRNSMVIEFTSAGSIFDAAGRYIAPPQTVVEYVRPDGPWNQNGQVVDEQPLTVICAWCPDFDRNDPRNATASHGICPTCVARLESEESVAA